MDILFVLPSFHTNLFFAFKALQEAGYRIHLVCAKDREGANGITHTHIVLDENQITFHDAYKLLTCRDPDIVVIRKTARISRLMYWASVLQRRKTIGYDQRPYLRPRHIAQVLWGPLKGRPIRRITPVHGMPGTGKPDPGAYYLPFPVETMPCNETRDYAPEGTVRILCVGKLTERRKNQFLLIRALEFLADDFDYRVTFVGSSSLNIQNPDQNHFDALKEYASHGPLAGRVTVVPDAPFDDMMKFYRTHDVCVLPSRAEPLGTAPLEAMAQGCAAIVSSGAGSSYYVEAACEAGLPCGAVFPSGNVHALQHSLDALISDRDRLQELGQNAAQWSRREFAPDVFLRRFQALMR